MYIFNRQRDNQVHLYVFLLKRWFQTEPRKKNIQNNRLNSNLFNMYIKNDKKPIAP